MLTHQTVTQLRSLRLDGMARAFEEQLTQPAATGLAFEERFGLLVDRELAWRDTRRLERLLKQAKLKYADACIENLDRRSARGLDARQLASLAGVDWIRAGQNLLITGATGLGKTWLACALGQAACRQGFSVRSTPASAGSSRSCASRTATAASAVACSNSPRPTCCSSTTSRSRPSANSNAPICSKCSTIARAARRR